MPTDTKKSVRKKSRNGSIFADPFDFDRGATDVIFTLPNGMLAFIIADENDRIVGESNLLLDTFQSQPFG